MGEIATLGRTAWRNYVTDGVPSSGNNKPKKSEIVAFVDKVDEFFDGFFSSSVAIVFATKAAMDANLNYSANQRAEVLADGANNGVYRKVGASGIGSWAYVGPVIDAKSDINENRFFGDSGNSSLSGTDNVGLGVRASDALTTGADNTALGTDALTAATTAARNVAVGKLALSATNAADNTAVGYAALVNATEFRNTAVGSSAGSGITVGERNTFIGYAAGTLGGGQVDNVDDCVAIGALAYTTGSNQAAFPDTIDEVRMFGSVMFRGYLSKRAFFFGELAGNRNISTGGALVGIGSVALANATTATQCTAVGDYAMNEHVSGSNCAAVGAQSMRRSINLIDCVALGSLTLANATTGVGGVAVGHRAMEFSLNANNNTGVGDSALWLQQGQGNVAVGYRVCEYAVSGDDNISIGRAASINRGTGSRNVTIGNEAGSFPGVTPNPTTGVGAQAAGNDNVAVGYRSLRNATSNDNTALGTQAGDSITTGDKNTFLGSDAGNNGSQKVDATNSTAIGFGSYTDANNQIVLGDANVTEVKVRSTAKLTLTGGRISFPATANPSADANTLDDYEEGTSTPTVTASSGTFTSVSCALDYTKIGDRVFWNATVTVTTIGTAAGEMLIPLPFTAAVASLATGFNTTNFFTAAGRVIAGTATALLSKYDGTPIAVSGGVTVRASGHYKI